MRATVSAPAFSAAPSVKVRPAEAGVAPVAVRAMVVDSPAPFDEAALEHEVREFETLLMVCLESGTASAQKGLLFAYLQELKEQLQAAKDKVVF